MIAGRLSIIIVNYRTARLTTDCLRSIAAQVGQLPEARVVVVDNDSQDGSVDDLLETIQENGWQEWATVLPLDRNGGFAFGNNRGIQHAVAASSGLDYVMLLNPDTIARPGAIRALVDFMDANAAAGIAGSVLENAEGGVERSAHPAPSPCQELKTAASLGVLDRALNHLLKVPDFRMEPHECDWVSGASMIIRRKVFDRVGLLDEGFFLYFEEVDFCTRTKRNGWEVWFVPASQVVHLEGAATGIRNIRRRRPAYWFDSRRRYFVKHHGISGLLFADTLWAIGRFSLALRRLLRLGGGHGNPGPIHFAFDLLWGDFRSILTGRVWSIRREKSSQ
jgi:N-acetylglucosaminyl-diphospho-decaprenol L-rhamnosyltransferase